MYQQWNNNYIKLLQQCPFLQADIQVIYKQCYLPTVSYPLPATSIPAAKPYNAQGKVTSLFLTKLGYPQSFPWAIAYANTDHGRIGLHHLGDEQGLQKILQLVLKHLCTKTGIGQGLLYCPPILSPHDGLTTTCPQRYMYNTMEYDTVVQHCMTIPPTRSKERLS